MTAAEPTSKTKFVLLELEERVGDEDHPRFALKRFPGGTLLSIDDGMSWAPIKRIITFGSISEAKLEALLVSLVPSREAPPCAT